MSNTVKPNLQEFIVLLWAPEPWASRTKPKENVMLVTQLPLCVSETLQPAHWSNWPGCGQYFCHLGFTLVCYKCCLLMCVLVGMNTMQRLCCPSLRHQLKLEFPQEAHTEALCSWRRSLSPGRSSHHSDMFSPFCHGWDTDTPSPQQGLFSRPCMAFALYLNLSFMTGPQRWT